MRAPELTSVELTVLRTTRPPEPTTAPSLTPEEVLNFWNAKFGKKNE